MAFGTMGTSGEVASNWDDSAGVVSLDGVIALKEQGSAPDATADYAKLYALDDSGTTELYVKDSGGNPTKLSG